VILLDTNALIWSLQGHKRAQPLARQARQYLSPASVLELQFLLELGRIRLAPHVTLTDGVQDDRWALDEPPAGRWFTRAADMSWTRDPFDRLLVAHASLRGWRLATGDDALIERLGPQAVLVL
jgi:PIN domain nuclease of toxin-antitoxin system